MDKLLLLMLSGILLTSCTKALDQNPRNLELLILTIATEESDGYKRFMSGADYLDLSVVVSGMSGHCYSSSSESQCSSSKEDARFVTIKKALEKYKEREDLVVLFTENENTILTHGKEDILEAFFSMNARIVFPVESTPPEELQPIKIGDHYMSTSGMIGWAKEVWTVVSEWEEDDNENHYLTMIYLNPKTKNKLNATIDTNNQIFLNIKTSEEKEVTDVGGDPERPIIEMNNTYESRPMVVQGSGIFKAHVNYLGNYVPNGWNFKDGCSQCDQDLLEVDYSNKDSIPHVLLVIYMIKGTPFLEDFFRRIVELDYDKSRISLYIQSSQIEDNNWISKFLREHKESYKSVVSVPPDGGIDIWRRRNAAVEHCIEIECDYFFNVDSLIQVTNPETLKYLIQKNKEFVAPFVRKFKKYWSNFWGAYKVNGYYEKSKDYDEIVEGEIKGIWNVPHINSIYLIKGSTIRQLLKKTSKLYGDFTMLDMDEDTFDPELLLCEIFRDQGVFMYISNEEAFGRMMSEMTDLTSSTDEEDEEGEGEEEEGEDEEEKKDNKKSYRLYPDIWEIKRNRQDWEERYLHPDFKNVIKPDTKVQEPCPDVYIFPLLSERLSNELVETAEEAGLWSTGSNNDPRVRGGYENVPTIDVRMEQLGLKKEWLYFMSKYPKKVVKKVYPGYGTDADSNTMFIVRYKPTEQPSLRPHHDHATWTINIALNTHNKDYEGGGARFIRYNCSVTDLPKGWAILHPGRLTHYHEGLPTTKGTRYIFVSFMDP